MNRSEISNDFNFEYELDITQNKKIKDQSFSKTVYGFEDFMNIGDRTMKSEKMSSKIYNNTSEILKKEQDSFVNPNLGEYATENSIRPKKNPSVLENLSLSNSPENLIQAISPKFADQMKTLKSIQQDTKKQIQLQKVESDGRAGNQAKTIAENAFKKKDYVGKQKEDEYKQLQDQIHYYEDSLQKIIYQNQKMQDETENLMANFNANTYDIYLQTYSKEIQQINNQIQQQRNLEAQLTRMIDQLEDEYQLLVNSIKTSNFARPVKMKDEAKALVDQINTLKAEFEALERDDGSLNLSSTLLQHQSSNHQIGNTFRLPPKKDCKVGSLRIQQIYEQNKKSEDPRFLQNIKMACLRDEWNIYSNGQIQVNVSYRNSPIIKVTLGNKINKDLQKFSLTEGTTPKLEGQTISAKSYIVHQIQMKQDLIDQLFVKCELSYSIFKIKKSIALFIPTGITNFGDFSPITQKEFLIDAGREAFQNNSGFRPIDKKLVSNITQIEHFMPNLLIDRENYKCFGLFISPFNDFTFLIIRQKGQLASIAAKTPNWPLIRVIEFIFTL